MQLRYKQIALNDPYKDQTENSEEKADKITGSAALRRKQYSNSITQIHKKTLFARR